MNKLLMCIIAFILSAINWLAFHDLFETHTIRDWLMLVASVLIFAFFAQITFRKAK